MRRITDRGMALIKEHEGFVPYPYKCPAGYWTVGYGHVILGSEDYTNGITQAHAEKLLRWDVMKAQASVLRNINTPLSDCQYDALVSFTFNLGGGALQRSTLRRKVNAGLHEEVPAEFRRWVFAGGRKLRGLVLRREAEAALYAEYESQAIGSRDPMPMTIPEIFRNLKRMTP